MGREFLTEQLYKELGLTRRLWSEGSLLKEGNDTMISTILFMILRVLTRRLLDMDGFGNFPMGY